MNIYGQPASGSQSGRYPRQHLVLAVALGLIVGFALALSPTSDAASKRVIVDLPVPIAAREPAGLAAETLDVEKTTHAAAVAEPGAYVVKSGDSLSHIFSKAGLSHTDLDDVMASGKDAKALLRLQPGQHLHFVRDDAGQLTSLTFEANKIESLVVERRDSGKFSTRWDKKPIIPYTTYSQGVVRSSLMQAGQDAGLSSMMIMQMAELFGWDIDFALDVHKGDSFKIIYEEMFVEGQKVRDGVILAAEFVNQGKRYTAVRFDRKDGTHQYYSAEGNALKKAFLRSPVDFARISSHFNLARRHPILHTIRAHKGTDYAGPYGTPVRTTGDGVISLAGRQGGYGNVLKVNHGRGYETLYAHLQRFAKGIRPGTRVSQGQVIGYIGSSGLATGPHLHFEFYINRQVRNPVTVALPEALPIAGPERIAFKQVSGQRMKQMATFAAAYGTGKVALNETR